MVYKCSIIRVLRRGNFASITCVDPCFLWKCEVGWGLERLMRRDRGFTWCDCGHIYTLLDDGGPGIGSERIA